MLLSLTLLLTWLERCSGAAGVFMEPQLQARAGDSVLLRCLFLDPDSKGWTLHKVDWLHKAGAGTQEELVFYYYSNYGVPVGRFKNRVQWQGNMSRWDGSIRLQDARVNDSGIYECELRLLQNSSIFRSRTVLHVSPAVLRGGGAADAEDAAPPRDSGFWPAVVGCGCVAVVVAFLAGLCVRKRFATNTALERMGKSSSNNKAEVRAEAGGITGVGCVGPGLGRLKEGIPHCPGTRGHLLASSSHVACPVTGVRQPLRVWGCSVPNTPICPLQEAIYSSIPGAEIPKAEQEAKKKRRAEDTYITMVRSCSRHGGTPTSLSLLPGSQHPGPHSPCQTPASRAPCPLQTHPGTRGEAHTLSLAPCSTPLTAGTTASMCSWPRGRSRRNGWQRGHRGMGRARNPTAGHRKHFPGLQNGRNSCAVG
uniref:Uncharacterized protein n=1 Tax=Corvus moneduloides TaxID=1196302 RepID=A0A8U7NP38_CORMO